MMVSAIAVLVIAFDFAFGCFELAIVKVVVVRGIINLIFFLHRIDSRFDTFGLWDDFALSHALSIRFFKLVLIVVVSVAIDH